MESKQLKKSSSSWSILAYKLIFWSGGAGAAELQLPGGVIGNMELISVRFSFDAFPLLLRATTMMHRHSSHWPWKCYAESSVAQKSHWTRMTYSGTHGLKHRWAARQMVHFECSRDRNRFTWSIGNATVSRFQPLLLSLTEWKGGNFETKSARLAANGPPWIFQRLKL